MEPISTVSEVMVADAGWTRRTRWSVFALALGVFAVGTDEFVLAGMLPLLGGTFGISIAAAGQVVTAFALVCAVLAPVLGTLTARWPRRRILLLALGVYLAGNAATALAPTFPALVAAQMCAAVGAGLFVPAASVTAAALVSYISAVFDSATGGDPDRLALLLFVFGLVGTLANYAGGALADRLGGGAVASGAIVLLAAALLVMPLATDSFAAATVMVVAYGIPAWALTTPQQHRLIALDPASASVYVSLNAAVLYLAISLSGAAGAAGIGWLGAGRLAPAAAVLALLALGLSELAHRLNRRPVASIIPVTEVRGRGTPVDHVTDRG